MARPDRFCNYVYTWSLERVENRAEFDTDLLAPLPGQARKVQPPTAAEVQREGDDFMTFMGEMTG